MRNKTLKLDFKPEYDFRLIGLSSNTKDYFLCYTVNRILELDFVRQDDISFTIQDREAYFSISFYDDEIMKRKYKLIHNKTYQTTEHKMNNPSLFVDIETILLIPEMSKIDYFIQFFGQWGRAEWNEILRRLRRCPHIVAAAEINPLELKSKEYLIFE